MRVATTCCCGTRTTVLNSWIIVWLHVMTLKTSGEQASDRHHRTYSVGVFSARLLETAKWNPEAVDRFVRFDLPSGQTLLLLPFAVLFAREASPSVRSDIAGHDVRRLAELQLSCRAGRPTGKRRGRFRGCRCGRRHKPDTACHLAFAIPVSHAVHPRVPGR